MTVFIHIIEAPVWGDEGRQRTHGNGSFRRKQGLKTGYIAALCLAFLFIVMVYTFVFVPSCAIKIQQHVTKYYAN